MARMGLSSLDTDRYCRNDASEPPWNTQSHTITSKLALEIRSSQSTRSGHQVASLQISESSASMALNQR